MQCLNSTPSSSQLGGGASSSSRLSSAPSTSSRRCCPRPVRVLAAQNAQEGAEPSSRRSGVAQQQHQQQQLQQELVDQQLLPPPQLLRDPEATLRRYGAFFGKTFRLPAWWDEVPRVRVRTIAQRAKDDLVELAVLNERLNGEVNPWEARSRLELLRKKRKNWEHIVSYVTAADATATLALIEEANEQAELLLSDEAQERASVSDLKLQLQDLQAQVDQASQRLQATQSRVEQNLQRVAQLKAEAATLERLQTLTGESASTTTASSSSSSSRPAAAAVASSSSSITSSSRSVATAAVATAAPPASTATTAGSSSNSSSRTTTTTTSTSSSSSSKKAGGGAGNGGSKRGSSVRPDRGLRSSLEAEQALKEFWYPAEFSSQLDANTLVPFELFDEPWVLFRDAEGRPSCIRDECAHRACPLSLGEVVDGKVSCAYHGWQFDGDGSCTKMPSTVHCRNVSVAALPCVEKDGFIWVWPGEGVPPEVPSTTQPPAGYDIHAEIKLEVPVEHGLLIENLLDLAHAPFTHQGTFANGWPVPDVVKFHANKLLAGQWDPYPIDMAFQPPCMTISKIGLAQPGKIMRGVTADNCERHLHQLHICAPGKKGTTRLLYRMSMDFLGWARYVPGIQKVWKGVAGQVLSEDLKLVLGQQERMERGADTWANPVSYDKLAVRYRRWRNGVASGRLPDGTTSAGGNKEAAITMTAGELFRLDEMEGFVDLAETQRLQQEEAAAAAGVRTQSQSKQQQQEAAAVAALQEVSTKA